MRRALLVAVLTLTVAGCGGGDESSKADFIAQADKVCKEFDQKAQDLPRPEGVGELEEYAQKAGDLSKETRDQLKDLDPPDEVKGDFDEFVKQGERGIEEIEKLEQAAKSNDEAELTAIVGRIGELDQKQNDAAKKIGLKDCGSN